MDQRLTDPDHELDDVKPHRPGFFARIRRNFLTGLVFIAPIAVTLWFIWWAINKLDSMFRPFIPTQFLPENLIGYDIPGIGVVFFIVVATIVGWMTKGFLGLQISRFLGNFVNNFPIVRSIYNGLKQIFETVFSDNGQNFQSPCLVEYPRKGIYAVGFIATKAQGEVREKSGHDDLIAVFVPTTPNPTSGFLLYFPKSEVKNLDMSVEDAAKLIISAGLVEPDLETQITNGTNGK